MSPAARPDRDLELALLADHELVGGLDEVGRGALAGPVSVGLAVVSRSTADSFPPGLADSKQLSPSRRRALVGPCRGWLADHAVAHASPTEIDALGIVGALRLAGRRALAEVASRGRAPDIVILDGASDWLSAPEPDPTAASDERAQAASTGRPDAAASTPPVRTEVKADARCAVVAAASVLAKVERDALMAALPDPGYDWAANKGYAAPAHVQALRALGACEQHRLSWRLPGLGRHRRPRG